MITVEDLAPGQSLPDALAVEVRSVEWNAGKSRRAEVELVDIDGNPIQFVDYEGADISVDWTVGHRYRISQCSVQKGGGGYDLALAPSKRTRIVPLGPANQSTRLLVVGDTHVGRAEHPRTGESINPVDAFGTAVTYGIENRVDAVIHVGDIFHDTATHDEGELVNQQVFQPLADADIPFYYVRGNHEAPAGNAVLDDRASTLCSNLSTAGVSVGNSVRVFGIDHDPDGNLLRNGVVFPSSVSETVSILVLHQTIEQLSGKRADSVDLERLTRRFGGYFDLIICGHHHDAIQKQWSGRPVMYTGASEKMSTNDNPTDRVAWLLTIEGDEVSCEQYDIP